MNSRIARKESRANNTVVKTGPSRIVALKIAAMTHHERIRAFRFATVARAESEAARRERMKPITEETRRMPPTMRGGAGCRDPWGSGGGFFDERAAGPREKSRLGLPGLDPDRREEAGLGDEGNGELRALREDAAEVLEMNGNEGNVRIAFCEVIEPRLEVARLLRLASSALGKDDDRLPRLERETEAVHRVIAAGHVAPGGSGWRGRPRTRSSGAARWRSSSPRPRPGGSARALPPAGPPTPRRNPCGWRGWKNRPLVRTVRHLVEEPDTVASRTKAASNERMSGRSPVEGSREPDEAAHYRDRRCPRP